MEIYKPGTIVTVDGHSAKITKISIDEQGPVYEIGFWANSGDWKTFWVPESEISGEKERLGFR